MEDLLVKMLIIEEDRPEHIAKHDITLDEVFEVNQSNYVYIRTRRSLVTYWQNKKGAILNYRDWAAERTVYLWFSHCSTVPKRKKAFISS